MNKEILGVVVLSIITFILACIAFIYVENNFVMDSESAVIKLGYLSTSVIIVGLSLLLIIFLQNKLKERNVRKW